MSGPEIEGDLCLIPANPDVKGDLGSLGAIPTPQKKQGGAIETVQKGIEFQQTSALAAAGFKMKTTSAPPSDDLYERSKGVLKEAYNTAIKAGPLASCPDNSKKGPSIPIADFNEYVRPQQPNSGMKP